VLGLVLAGLRVGLGRVQGQAGREGFSWLRGSFPLSPLFFLFYFSKPFSNRILNTINFNLESHSTNKKYAPT